MSNKFEAFCAEKSRFLRANAALSSNIFLARKAEISIPGFFAYPPFQLRGG